MVHVKSNGLRHQKTFRQICISKLTDLLVRKILVKNTILFTFQIIPNEFGEENSSHIGLNHWSPTKAYQAKLSLPTYSQIHWVERNYKFGEENLSYLEPYQTTSGKNEPIQIIDLDQIWWGKWNKVKANLFRFVESRETSNMMRKILRQILT